MIGLTPRDQFKIVQACYLGTIVLIPGIGSSYPLMNRLRSKLQKGATNCLARHRLSAYVLHLFPPAACFNLVRYQAKLRGIEGHFGCGWNDLVVGRSRV